MNKINRRKIMEDCVLYDNEKRQCKALNELYCAIDEKPCSFYKQKRTAGKGGKENVKK